jgi:transcriptional regulator with XRE-family HTH domain
MKKQQYGKLMKIALKLKLFRAQFRLSQTDVAKQIGTTKMTISYLENGEWHLVSYDILSKVQEYLNKNGIEINVELEKTKMKTEV